MDRGVNLGALTEEEDEASWGGSDSDSGEEGEEGIRSGEPNQFDNLCDGVLGCLALVHASLQEMLELKDELLKHSLPPGVLCKTTLVTSKVFRSFSDLHVPVGELIRMVRLYSTPWEEKSTALKKLHDDYEGKKTQLNIAIKRLEFIDAQSKQIARERRVMNWEKLFAKLTAAKGHGRRWKFLIDAFKKRANMGMEQMQEYLDTMDVGSSDEEEEEEMEVATQMQHVDIRSPFINQEGEAEDQSSESESSSEEDENDKHMRDNEVVSEGELSMQMKVEEEEEEKKKTVHIKLPTKDQEVWADERIFDRELHIRVYQPEGLDCRDLKCAVNFGPDMWKTDILDVVLEEEEEVNVVAPKEEKKPESKTPMTPKRAARGRGRGGRSTVSPSKTPTLQMAPLPENEEEALTEGENNTKKRHYEECSFSLDEETPPGTWLPPGVERVKWPEHLRASVHFGPKEEIVAMATIEMADLLNLELLTVVLPPPVGDIFDLEKALEEEQERAEKAAKAASPEAAISEVERANVQEKDETTEEGKVATEENDVKKEGAKKEDAKITKPVTDPEVEKQVNEVLGNREPINFPLYSIHAGKSDAVHLPCGNLPLLCFWVKKERPTKLSKMTESESVNALVYDLTGIDLAVTTKDDLHKEMRDEALSTISFTPEPKEEEEEEKEEVVSRLEYDHLMSAHNEEMEMLQTEYEQRLQELLDTIHHLQQSQLELQAIAALPQPMVSDHQYSRSPPRSRTPHQATSSSLFDSYGQHTIQETPKVPSSKHTETEPLRQTRTARIGKPLPKWGKDLSENFFERLQHFEELTAQKKMELRDQLMSEISQNIEKKLASQYKLTNHTEEGLFDALQDVSLPAVFLPNKTNNMHIYNPRANKYFHPTGASGARLCQPPSMLQLPPLPKSKMSVLNLFDMTQNFHREGPEWLMQRYLSATTSAQDGASAHQPQVAAVQITPASPWQQTSAPQSRPQGTSAGSKGRQSSAGIKQPTRNNSVTPSRPSVLKSRPVTKSGDPSLPYQRSVVSLPGRTPSQNMGTPLDYGPPRSSMTTATPGMLKTPNPVGQSETTILCPLAPTLALGLVEAPTPS